MTGAGTSGDGAVALAMNGDAMEDNIAADAIAITEPNRDARAVVVISITPEISVSPRDLKAQHE